MAACILERLKTWLAAQSLSPDVYAVPFCRRRIGSQRDWSLWGSCEVTKRWQWLRWQLAHSLLRSVALGFCWKVPPTLAPSIVTITQYTDFFPGLCVFVHLRYLVSVLMLTSARSPCFFSTELSRSNSDYFEPPRGWEAFLEGTLLLKTSFFNSLNKTVHTDGACHSMTQGGSFHPVNASVHL